MFPISLIFKTAIKDIQTHWDTLKGYDAVLIDSDVYDMKDQSQYLLEEIEELRNFEEWMESLLELEYSSSYLEIKSTKHKQGEKWIATRKTCHLYPECILNQTHKLAVELRYLLPNTPSVKSILPLLLVGYIAKRRGAISDKSKSRNRVQDSERGCTEGLLVNLLYGKDKFQHDGFKKRSQQLFCPQDWNNRFHKLKYIQLTQSKLETALSLFGKSMLFLFLAYKTQDLCNLTLSFSLFEEKTGCLGLLGLGFLIHAECEPEITNDPLRDQILSFLERTFDSKENPQYTLLDMFIMNFVAALVRRDVGINYEEYVQKNKWAYENVYEMYELYCIAHGFCEPVCGICSDETYALMCYYQHSQELSKTRKKRHRPLPKRRPIRHKN